MYFASHRADLLNMVKKCTGVSVRVFMLKLGKNKQTRGRGRLDIIMI